ncbi:FadR/GntR family transcriptional regulator [Desulfocurvus sp. DL9XJH121]
MSQGEENTAPVGRTAFSRAVERIRSLVRSGEIAPGGRLPSERYLAEEFGVARSSVREAIRTLADQGVIESRRGAGTFLVDLPQSEILARLTRGLANHRSRMSQVFGFRRLLEPQLVREAVKNATPEQRARLWAALGRQERVMAQGGSGRQEDRELHRLIAEATGNPIAVEAVRTLARMFDEPRAQHLESRERDRVSLEGHRRMLQAFDAGDADGAAQEMVRHLSEMEAFLCEQHEDPY